MRSLLSMVVWLFSAVTLAGGAAAWAQSAAQVNAAVQEEEARYRVRALEFEKRRIDAHAQWQKDHLSCRADDACDARANKKYEDARLKIASDEIDARAAHERRLAEIRARVPLQGRVEQKVRAEPPRPGSGLADAVWQFVTTSPTDNGVHDVMSGFLQGLGHVEKPLEVRKNQSYNRGYLVGAIFNVGSNLIQLRPRSGPGGQAGPHSGPAGPHTGPGGEIGPHTGPGAQVGLHPGQPQPHTRPGAWEEPPKLSDPPEHGARRHGPGHDTYPPETPTVRVPPARGVWSARDAEGLLAKSHAEIHVPPAGASTQEVRRLTQARHAQEPTPRHTVWQTREEAVADLQSVLNTQRAAIEDLRPGERARWVVPLRNTRTGWHSEQGGPATRITFDSIRIVVEKSFDGRGIRLLHLMPMVH